MIEPRHVTRASAKAEQARKDAVAALGCALCWRIHGPHAPGPVELHHRRSNGWGKGDYLTLIPLCYRHHRGDDGIHTLGVKRWEREFCTQQELLDWVNEQLLEKA